MMITAQKPVDFASKIFIWRFGAKKAGDMGIQPPPIYDRIVVIYDREAFVKCVPA